MFAFAKLPREYAVHLHTVAMFHVFIVKMQLCLYNMAHLYETPYLIERCYILRLQAIQAVIQRIGSSKQVPCTVHLAVARCLLQHHALLAYSLEPSYCSEEGMMLQPFQCF